MTAATQTHCPYCSLQCGMHVQASPPADTGSPATVEVSGREFPTNRGGLCLKGAHAGDLLGHPERVITPLARDRRGGPLRPVSWDDALDRITGPIRAAQREHGPDAVGCFGGGGLTNEKAYQLGKFARVALGTANVDYNGRFCMSSAAAAATRAFGIDRGLPFPLPDVAEADVVLLVGSNPADTMPPAMRWFEAGRDRGARHIVIDPRRTSTARLAHHLPALPGTDLALANGLLHIAIREGLVDHDYIARRTTGFDAVRRAVRADWPDRTERITGIPVAELHECVRALAGARTAMILTAGAPSSTPTAPSRPRPGSTWRWRSGCPDGAGGRAGPPSPDRATARAGASTG
jgi:assimilatory nitrate reductase catalytic subunit